MSATQFQAATGRPLRTGVTTETVNLLVPGQLYGERVNNLDMRVAKVVRIKRTRANIGVDFYNLTNSSPVLTYNNTYSPTSTAWLTPTSVLAARVAKIGATFDF